MSLGFNVLFAGPEEGGEDDRTLSVTVANRGRSPTTVHSIALFGPDGWGRIDAPPDSFTSSTLDEGSYRLEAGSDITVERDLSEIIAYMDTEKLARCPIYVECDLAGGRSVRARTLVRRVPEPAVPLDAPEKELPAAYRLRVWWTKQRWRVR